MSLPPDVVRRVRSPWGLFLIAIGVALAASFVVECAQVVSRARRRAVEFRIDGRLEPLLGQPVDDVLGSIGGMGQVTWQQDFPAATFQGVTGHFVNVYFRDESGLVLRLGFFDNQLFGFEPANDPKWAAFHADRPAYLFTHYLWRMVLKISFAAWLVLLIGRLASRSRRAEYGRGLLMAGIVALIGAVASPIRPWQELRGLDFSICLSACVMIVGSVWLIGRTRGVPRAAGVLRTCAKCGYILHKSESGLCAECGASDATGTLAAAAREMTPRVRRALAGRLS